MKEGKVATMMYCVNDFLLASLQEKLKFILQATFQHARNLAFLTTVYKIVTLLFRKLTGKEHPVFTFIGAFLGGYFVFGENNKLNMQVCTNACRHKLHIIGWQSVAYEGHNMTGKEWHFTM